MKVLVVEVPHGAVGFAEQAVDLVDRRFRRSVGIERVFRHDRAELAAEHAALGIQFSGAERPQQRFGIDDRVLEELLHIAFDVTIGIRAKYAGHLFDGSVRLGSLGQGLGSRAFAGNGLTGDAGDRGLQPFQRADVVLVRRAYQAARGHYRLHRLEDGSHRRLVYDGVL